MEFPSTNFPINDDEPSRHGPFYESWSRHRGYASSAAKSPSLGAFFSAPPPSHLVRVGPITHKRELSHVRPRATIRAPCHADHDLLVAKPHPVPPISARAQAVRQRKVLHAFLPKYASFKRPSGETKSYSGARTRIKPATTEEESPRQRMMHVENASIPGTP